MFFLPLCLAQNYAYEVLRSFPCLIQFVSPWTVRVTQYVLALLDHLPGWKTSLLMHNRMKLSSSREESVSAAQSTQRHLEMWSTSAASCMRFSCSLHELYETKTQHHSPPGLKDTRGGAITLGVGYNYVIPEKSIQLGFKDIENYTTSWCSFHLLCWNRSPATLNIKKQIMPLQVHLSTVPLHGLPLHFSGLKACCEIPTLLVHKQIVVFRKCQPFLASPFQWEELGLPFFSSKTPAVMQSTSTKPSGVFISNYSIKRECFPHVCHSHR